MSDSSPTPTETAAQDPATPPIDDLAQEKKRDKRAILVGCLIAILIVALIILALWLLRGCVPERTTGTRGTAKETTAPADGTSTNTLDNRIHAAIHAPLLSNGQALDTLVYIFSVSAKEGVSVLVTLTPLDTAPKKTTAQNVANAVEDAILTAVPEVTKVEVIDASRVPVSAKTR